MGLFSKKKNAESSDSVLSESEIQKKLYGEFSARSPHVVIGEREYSKDPLPSPVLPRESRDEKEPIQDLFSTPTEDLTDTEMPPARNFQEQKQSEQAPRYVPLHDFEKRSVTAVPPASEADPYTRFRYNRPQENKMDALLELGKGVVQNVKALFDSFMDPKQVTLRRFFYWGVAVLVVFLLFWGVNSLNSQREEAMRARYKIPGKVAVVEAPVAVLPAPVVEERQVTITPAPVRPKKVAAPDTAVKTPPVSSSTYVIQVVTYPSKQDADQIVASLKKAGLQAFVQENARPSGRVFYLVLIGGFRTASEAQSQLLKFRALEAARPFQDAFVRTNRS